MNALVKLLSGSQEGAEFVLAPGTYVVGSGDDADLMLADAAVAARHATLVIGDQDWCVEPIEGAEVRVDGAAVSGAVTLAPYRVVTVGGVHFALGPDGPWPALPALPSARPPAEERPVADASAPESAAPPEPAAAAPERAPARSWKGLWAVLLALVLFGAAGMLAWRGLHASSAERLADRLRRAGFAVVVSDPYVSTRPPAGTVAVVAMDGGGVELAGLLATDEERQAVVAAAGGLDASRTRGLRTMDEEVAAARDKLDGEFPGLALDADGNRFAATLSGVVERAADGQAAYRLARTALDPRIALRRNLWSWPELFREAELEAARADLAGLAFERDGRRLRALAATWPTPRAREAFLRRLAERVGERMAGPFAEALQAEPEPAVAAAVPPPGDVVFVPPPLPEPDAVPEEPSEPVVPSLPVEPAEEPTDEPVAPPPEPAPEWRVAEVTDHGFKDQNGLLHNVGDYLTPNLRIVQRWPDGVVLQRGRETILAAKDSTIIDNINAK